MQGMRITGARPLARAGVSEAKLLWLGRWAYKAYRRHAREALFGARGGGLASAVEKAAGASVDVECLQTGYAAQQGTGLCA